MPWNIVITTFSYDTNYPFSHNTTFSVRWSTLISHAPQKFPHWSSRLQFFPILLFAGIFSIIFRRCPLSLWKFACGFSPLGCLPATAEKKRKKIKAGNRISRRGLLLCVCSTVERYILLFHFFNFLVLLYSSRDDDAAAAIDVCVCAELFWEAYCCFFPSLAIVWSHECVGVFIIFSSFLPFVASSLFCSTLREAGSMLIQGAELVCVFWGEKRKHKEKLCKNVINNTQCCFWWIQMRCWSRFFGGLLYCYSRLLQWFLCEDWIIFHPPFVRCECDFPFAGEKQWGKIHI